MEDVPLSRNMFGNKWNLILIIAIFVGVTVYFIARNGSSPYSISMADQTIKVTGENDYSYSLSMDSIDSVELTEIEDHGECILDACDGKHICGIFKNEQFGQYDIWTIKKISPVVVITDKNGHVFAVNYESARSTQELYKALLEIIDK